MGFLVSLFALVYSLYIGGLSLGLFGDIYIYIYSAFTHKKKMKS